MDEGTPDKAAKRARGREYERKYAETHRAEIAERSRRWKLENPEKVREQRRRYNEANPDSFKAWLEVNREYNTQRNREYQAANREHLLKRGREQGRAYRERRRYPRGRGTMSTRKIGEEDRRTKRPSIPLSPHELTLVDQAARKAGMTRGSYQRAAVLAQAATDLGLDPGELDTARRPAPRRRNYRERQAGS